MQNKVDTAIKQLKHLRGQANQVYDMCCRHEGDWDNDLGGITRQNVAYIIRRINAVLETLTEQEQE